MHPLHLKLPATSANLGPGFDAIGLAMSFYLTIDAEPSSAFAITASGRNPDLCGSLERNLILDTYRNVLTSANRPIIPLSLRLNNEIPLGMGCGSSAAALLAGVLLANYFGDLGWTGYQAMEEACRREGHPDNVAACWLGGMTASAAQAPAAQAENASIATASFANAGERSDWKLLLVIPPASLSTEKARALLPATYSRADAVTNVQNTALLVSAFALGRADLLRTAMQDRIHQPYRTAACPLLTLLLPLADHPSVLGVALSGAGPSVLLIYREGDTNLVRHAIQQRLQGAAAELLDATISKGTSYRLL
ncbi:MAG TPA: homoserine kinase [Granulicella sp.]|nr:homoserine kinase [Granulicella sp.]